VNVNPWPQSRQVKVISPDIVSDGSLELLTKTAPYWLDAADE